MIIGADAPLPMGFRGRGITDADGIWRPQPFVVTREATIDEWRAHLREDGVDDTDLVPIGSHFYAISTD